MKARSFFTAIRDAANNAKNGTIIITTTDGRTYRPANYSAEKYVDYYDDEDDEDRETFVFFEAGLRKFHLNIKNIISVSFE